MNTVHFRCSVNIVPEQLSENRKHEKTFFPERKLKACDDLSVNLNESKPSSIKYRRNPAKTSSKIYSYLKQNTNKQTNRR